MRLFHILAFDSVVQGTTAIYTSPLFARQFATSDQNKVFVVADEVTGTSPTLTVQSEDGDGVYWSNKYGTAEINGVSLSTTGTTVAKGADGGGQPSAGWVRFKIQLGGTSPAARIRMWVTGRGSPIQ
jgi:hypothetical protein